MKDGHLLRLHPRVIHLDSLVHQLFHWFYNCPRPFLSRAKLLWVWFQNARKSQMVQTARLCITCQVYSQIQHRATLPSPGSLSSLRWILTVPTVLQRAKDLKEKAEKEPGIQPSEHSSGTGNEMGQGDLDLGHYCQREQWAQTVE